MDGLRIVYICPIAGRECVNLSEERSDPFTGGRVQELCAFGTKDGACSVAKLMEAMHSMARHNVNERWY